ncbi:hypothetical protein J4E93_004797 [Alternaria ventricosa]|uniref:uncharacterized protein n=1 Tax=Alternaria ventricosa TaxID=1187951 RepID=UPI0020C4EC8C|nr:uncharacterized protein J4E93_004797 [Alternaria ventricosa]KAI4646576.1 hypothetical protein J4E93_004797 [Alternaria ventricosa]
MQPTSTTLHSIKLVHLENGSGQWKGCHRFKHPEVSDSISSLTTLPNEILLQVFSHVDLHRSIRVLGYIPDDPPPSSPDEYLVSDFRANSRSLLNIALTCKRFTVLAREVLLSSLVLEVDFPETLNELSNSDIYGLIWRLQARPGWKRHIKQLRLCLPSEDRGIMELNGRGPVEPHVNYRVYEKACEIVASLDLPAWLKTGKIAELKGTFAHASASVFLALLPNIATLCIFDPDSYLTLVEAHSQATRPWPKFALRLPTAHVLTYLKYESPLPPLLGGGLEHYPNLHTLDLSIRLQGQIHSQIRMQADHYLNSRRAQPTIRHLRLDFEVRTVGVWNTTARACMTNILRAFPNLQTLEYYAESSDSKNPYRSVRAFPAYQANIQYYPTGPSAFEDDVYVDEQYWDRTIYDARSEVTDYQNLVDGMVHLRPNLETLQLPGGFWTLPGAMRKPLPRFDQFEQLKKLVIPQAALISIKLDNMRFDAVFEGDFELSPTQALPISLQHLKIFDVDLAFLESRWLQDLFGAQKANHWPRLQCVEILMGPTVTGLCLEELNARQRNAEFWKLVNEANFEVVVGRDEERPDA